LRQIAAILLLGIFLFNWFGYRLLTSFLEKEANQRLEAQLNENTYDETGLISLKIPVSRLPYYSNSKLFERIDGQVEMGGIRYNYVKRRLFGDSLELLCIPNQAVMNLLSAKDYFFRLVNDLQHNGQGKKANSHPGPSKNFTADLFAWDDPFSLHTLYSIACGNGIQYSAAIYSPVISCADQPPETSC
jgi:hypothetical protein